MRKITPLPTYTLLCSLCCLLLLSIIPGTPSVAQEIVTLDVQTCDTAELIQVFTAAQENLAAINLQADCVYVLTEVHNTLDGPNGLPSITGDMVLNGNNATISRSPDAPSFRILHISPEAVVTLNNLTVSFGELIGTPGLDGADGLPGDDGFDGNAGGNGFNGENGTAGSAARGAGIYNTGTLTLVNVTLVDNYVEGGVGGRGGFGGQGGRGGDGGESVASGGRGGDGGFGGDGGRGGDGQGGGIYNTGLLEITNSVLINNIAAGGIGGRGGDGGNGGNGGNSVSATGARGGDASRVAEESRVNNPEAVSNSDGGDGLGGAIFNSGTLRITRTTFQDNLSIGGDGNQGGRGGNGGVGGLPGPGGTAGDNGKGSSGGVGGDGGDGTGGAVHNTGTMEAAACLFVTNIAQGANGAKAGDGGISRLDFDQGDIVSDKHGRGGIGGYGGESAGSAVYNSGALRLTNCTLSANFGNGGDAGPGGISETGRRDLQGTGGNAGNSRGGGVFHAEGETILVNNTLFENGGSPGIAQPDGEEGVGEGGGIYGEAQIRNTIVANSLFSNCAGPTGVISLGHNLVTDDSCNLTAEGDLALVDPLLIPLQNNGGPTFTHALQPDSPAIDAGDNVACYQAPVSDRDQRDLGRRMDGNGDGEFTCDIGAFEAIGTPPSGPPAELAGTS